MATTPFLKMHGLGNDFVVLDARTAALDLTPERRRVIADRRLGVGCDQLIVLEPPTEREADVFMRIYNPDGGEAGACGNATRCVASVVMDERKTDHVTVQTIAGLLDSQKTGMGSNGLPVISVDMGPARLDWREIPVREACDTNHMPVGIGPLQDPVGTNMGNPHATFFVDDAAAIPLAELGPKLEHDRFFPERANIGVAQLLGDDKLRLRVWERGAGITLACGSGACAAVVAASRRGLVPRRADVILEGGTLTIEWLRDDHVLMTGGIAVAFKGELDRSLLT
ncbi:diaminopimelate epimerase [Reyranella soli]|uniref:Diaminopimelate epimerase n=1 Tax=Reyranella soli TaxID=1230389 RepID=A0A512NA10_9HYPH|nr:diaminopimelate epimerase [Reyranella soli]GEP55815.1 diaminopimelate epimerase [Reyranella soli]